MNTAVFQLSCLGLFIGSLVACNGTSIPEPQPGPLPPSAAAEPGFKKGGEEGGGAATFRVLADNGVSFAGGAALTVTYDGQKEAAELLVYSMSAGKTFWNAQLAPQVDDVANGSASMTLKPWSWAPGTGFINDGNGTNPVFSPSGNISMTLLPGGVVSGKVSAAGSTFSGTFEGSVAITCVVPASMLGASSSPGAPSPGVPSAGAALAVDSEFTTVFCKRFASLRK